MRSLLLPSLHSLDSLYFQGKDLYIDSAATSATIINSQSTMDIKGTTSKIATCLSGSNPCTAANGFEGTTCAAASSGKGGVMCSGNTDAGSSLPACPTIYTADDDNLKVTDGWNVWSASCAMSSKYNVVVQNGAGKTVKIKKSPSMSGELVIDRGSDTSTLYNGHFDVEDTCTLELEDVTLTGGYAVSSFVLCNVVNIRSLT